MASRRQERGWRACGIELGAESGIRGATGRFVREVRRWAREMAVRRGEEEEEVMRTAR